MIYTPYDIPYDILRWRLLALTLAVLLTLPVAAVAAVAFVWWLTDGLTWTGD